MSDVYSFDPMGKVSYAGSGIVTLLGALSLNQWATIIGIALGIGTFYVNYWYKKRKLEQDKGHHRRIEDIQRGMDDTE